MFIRNRYEERKKRCQNDLQRARLENFFGIKFEDKEQYEDFLDHIHKPITFDHAKKINQSMIYDLIAEGSDIVEVIDVFHFYLESYYQKLKDGNFNYKEEEDEDGEDGNKYGWYQGVVEEAFDDGLREIKNIDDVFKDYFEFLENTKNEYLMNNFRKKIKRK
jgi:hypothetical protein